MANWEIVWSAREYEPSDGRDADVGWAWDVQRDGERRTIGVEVSRTLAAVAPLSGREGGRRSCRCSTATPFRAVSCSSPTG
jgi:hypothetical protein